MTKDETIRGIATFVDHPNVYMGGPSRDALRKASLIFDFLEIDRLTRQLAEAKEDAASANRCRAVVERELASTVSQLAEAQRALHAVLPILDPGDVELTDIIAQIEAASTPQVAYDEGGGAVAAAHPAAMGTADD